MGELTLRHSSISLPLLVFAFLSRALTLEILVHLIEVERRRLHLGLGYPSMFDYCSQKDMEAIVADYKPARLASRSGEAGVCGTPAVAGEQRAGIVVLGRVGDGIAR